MKRIKLMLLSFVLLMVIGGALAFKAKYSNSHICYTTAMVATTCGTIETTSWPTNVAADAITTSYTTPAQPDGQGGWRCNLADDENPEITTPLNCNVSTMLKQEQ